MAITVGGTTITFNDATTQSTAGLTSAVTSVATGNGLSGGTITTSGTLTVACPSFNSVGSYVWGAVQITSGSLTVNGGNTYSAGSGNGQVVASHGTNTAVLTNSLSGTWRFMGGNYTYTYCAGNLYAYGILCRVS